MLESRPKLRVSRQTRIGREVRARWSFVQDVCAANEIDGTGQVRTIDDNVNPVAVAQFSDRSAGQRFRTDVADACSRRHAAETGVGDDGRVTYVGRGLMKKPYVVDVSSDGVFQMLKTKVDADGQPTWIGEPYPNASWHLAPVSDNDH